MKYKVIENQIGKHKGYSVEGPDGNIANRAIFSLENAEKRRDQLNAIFGGGEDDKTENSPKTGPLST